MSERINFLSNAETAKPRWCWARPPDSVWSFTVIYTRSGKSESKLFDLDESLLLLSYTSKTFIWTSLMKSTACSIQMASFKHKISDSHNKCETAWKFILFLPETVEIKIICIEVQKRLRGVAGTVWLQHWGAGWDDGGLAWGVDGFKLELRAHPEAPVGPGVGHYLDLWEQRERLTPNRCCSTTTKQPVLWQRVGEHISDSIHVECAEELEVCIPQIFLSVASILTWIRDALSKNKLFQLCSGCFLKVHTPNSTVSQAYSVNCISNQSS